MNIRVFRRCTSSWPEHGWAGSGVTHLRLPAGFQLQVVHRAGSTSKEFPSRCSGMVFSDQKSYRMTDPDPMPCQPCLPHCGQEKFQPIFTDSCVLVIIHSLLGLGRAITMCLACNCIFTVIKIKIENLLAALGDADRVNMLGNKSTLQHLFKFK